MEVPIGSDLREAEEVKKGITARQMQYLEAYRASGSAAKAATILGVSQDSAREALSRVARAYGKSSIKDLLDASNNSSTQVATPRELMKLIKSQDYRCALSGEKLTPKTAELDHKMPRSKGGCDTIDNLQWLDRSINRMKGQLSTEQFIAACRRVVQWAS